MMGAVVLKHLQNLPCNAHELSEMELPPPPTTTSSSSSSPSSGLNSSSNGNNSALSTSRDCVAHEIGAAVFGEPDRQFISHLICVLVCVLGIISQPHFKCKSK